MLVSILIYLTSSTITFIILFTTKLLEQVSLSGHALSDHAIFVAEFVNGRIVNQEWIYQNFHFDTFRIFGFVDCFEMECGCPKDMRRSRDASR